MVNPFLQSFWGVNQIYTTGDLENQAISSLQGPKKQKIVFLGHFQLSEGYIYILV